MEVGGGDQRAAARKVEPHLVAIRSKGHRAEAARAHRLYERRGRDTAVILVDEIPEILRVDVFSAPVAKHHRRGSSAAEEPPLRQERDVEERRLRKSGEEEQRRPRHFARRMMIIMMNLISL